VRHARGSGGMNSRASHVDRMEIETVVVVVVGGDVEHGWLCLDLVGHGAGRRR